MTQREPRGPGPLELRYLGFDPQVLISGAFLFEIPAGGSAPAFADIRRLVDARLQGPLRYRLRHVPARLAPPVWEETSLISDGVRTATVTARTSAAVFVVESSVVGGLLAEDPMAREVLTGLTATRPRSLRSSAIAG